MYEYPIKRNLLAILTFGPVQIIYLFIHMTNLTHYPIAFGIDTKYAKNQNIERVRDCCGDEKPENTMKPEIGGVRRNRKNERESACNAQVYSQIHIQRNVE